MEDMAQAVANKHRKVLFLFSKCHQQFNSQERFTPSEFIMFTYYIKLP